MALDKIQGWIPIIIGIITFSGGALAWYSAAIIKRYAAQRDFQHLKKNQEQISEGVASLFREQDRRFDELERDISEAKSLLTNLSIRLGGDESISSIIRRNNNR